MQEVEIVLQNKFSAIRNRKSSIDELKVNRKQNNLTASKQSPNESRDLMVIQNQSKLENRYSSTKKPAKKQIKFVDNIGKLISTIVNDRNDKKLTLKSLTMQDQSTQPTFTQESYDSTQKLITLPNIKQYNGSLIKQLELPSPFRAGRNIQTTLQNYNTEPTEILQPKLNKSQLISSVEYDDQVPNSRRIAQNQSIGQIIIQKHNKAEKSRIHSIGLNSSSLDSNSILKSGSKSQMSKMNIWDMMQIHDQDKYHKELQQQKLRKQNQQQKFRESLENQVQIHKDIKLQLQSKQKQEELFQMQQRVKSQKEKEEQRQRWIKQQITISNQINQTNSIYKQDLSLHSLPKNDFTEEGVNKIFILDQEHKMKIKKIMKENQGLLKDLISNKKQVEQQDKEHDHILGKLTIKVQRSALDQTEENYKKLVQKSGERNRIIDNFKQKNLKNYSQAQIERDSSLKYLFDRQEQEQKRKMDMMQEERQKLMKMMNKETQIIHLYQMEQKKYLDQQSKLNKSLVENEIIKKDVNDKNNEDLQRKRFKIENQQVIKQLNQQLFKEKRDRELEERMKINQTEFAINKSILNEIGVLDEELQSISARAQT